MTVYVDNAIHEWRGKRWAHMFCDGDIRELHRLAQAIGLKRAWFQDDFRLPHYDVTESKREQALKLGAKGVPISVTAEFIKRNREKARKASSKR